MLRIENGREKFYQWDVDQRLVVDNPDVHEIHFANYATSPALVCEVYEENGQRFADVPNILLQQPRTLIAYGCCAECVRAEAHFQVSARQKPADYVYTETEIKKYSDLDQRLDAVDEQIKELQESSAVFLINCTLNEKYSNVFDKTYAQILEAYKKGLLLEVRRNNDVFHFTGLIDGNPSPYFEFLHESGNWVSVLKIYTDDKVKYDGEMRNYKNLPNPQSIVLNVNGEAHEYDGSEKVEIDLDISTGTVQSVNGVQPDEDGNVQVEISEAVSDDHIREVVKPDIDEAVAAEASKRLYVELSEYRYGKYSLNVSFEELVTALQNKVEIWGVLLTYNEGKHEIVLVDYVSVEDPYVKLETQGSAWSNAGRKKFVIFADEIVLSDKGKLVASMLPNPYPLLLNIAGEQVSYDGNKKVTVDIPEPTTSLPWSAITDPPFGEIGTVLDTRLTPEDDGTTIAIPDVVKIEAEKTYKVTWNGAEYSCVAVAAELEGLPLVWIGDLGAMGGDTSTGEPFLIGTVPEEYVSTVGFGAAVMVLDGSTAVTLKIEAVDVVVKTLDPIYLPMSAIDARIDERLGAIENGTY